MFEFALATALCMQLPGAPGFVTLEDTDGTIASRRIDSLDALNATAEAILNHYIDSGAPIPEVLSVWTDFPLGQSRGGTYFIPLANDVTGIGLETLYGNPAVFESPVPPMKVMLLHNSIRLVEDGAIRHRAPVEGYGEYLFLLELSHLWGPAAQVPSLRPNELIGFPAHWSFFMNSGGPAGGNVWVSNGDGTFTTNTPPPGQLGFSMLDLYLMGLAAPEEVPNVTLLTNVQVPPEATDPIWLGAVMPRTFPWFDAEPLTVSASTITYSIEQIVQSNGSRVPAFPEAQTSWELGIALILTASISQEARAQSEQDFEPLALALAPAFERATMGRGRLEVITGDSVTPDQDAGTSMEVGAPDAGQPADLGSPVDAAVDAGMSVEMEPEEGGCSCTESEDREPGQPWMLLFIGALLCRKPLRSQRSSADKPKTKNVHA